MTNLKRNLAQTTQWTGSDGVLRIVQVGKDRLSFSLDEHSKHGACGVFESALA